MIKILKIMTSYLKICSDFLNIMRNFLRIKTLYLKILAWYQNNDILHYVTKSLFWEYLIILR